MLKVSDERDQILVAKTYEAGQKHVFAFWEELDEAQRRALLDQLAAIDFQLLGKLTKLIDQVPSHRAEIQPMPIEVAAGERRAALAEIGWQALRDGKVACLVVAGGQGTRLGWDGPKGTHPVGPVTRKSLFELFAEQVRATSGRAGRAIPWYVLTSTGNREATEAFFSEHHGFGLEEGQVRFLVQKDRPNTDPQGRLLMESKHRIAMSPNGHGGTYEALHEAGALETLRKEGVEQLFYFQVDNPLCRVADPVFVGAHIDAGADVSTKVVRKDDPAEKIGLLVLRDGKPGVGEYSEMSQEQQSARDPDGLLTYRGGNTAIHVFSIPFLRRLASSGFKLEHHVARKAVRCLDREGNPVVPEEPNACKFETFIFEVLAEADPHLAFEVPREEDFEPLKNKSGVYSPETVERAQSERARRWLQQAGAELPADARSFEVSPLTALDPVELQEKLPQLELVAQSGKLAI